MNPIKNFLRKRIIRLITLKRKPKIFCIGMNKTGTTSLKKAFLGLGFIIGKQRAAEHLLHDYMNGDYKPLLKYVKSAQVFQDIPFSLPKTYKKLHEAYPNSKFILTIRDSPEQWLDSITNYHSKLFGKNKKELPTKKELMEANYVYKGFLWDAMRSMAPIKETEPYQAEILMRAYIEYNQEVEEYFTEYPDQFLKINLAEKGSYQKLIDFLEITSPFNDFPWENKTSEIPENK